jgi:VIT1/CCC1 family predicted Fe2+/Mn2+ transporter
MPIKPAMIASVVVAAAVLFAVGILKAKWFELDWKKSGIEMAVIGTVAALVGYAVGLAFGVQA